MRNSTVATVVTINYAHPTSRQLTQWFFKFQCSRHTWDTRFCFHSTPKLKHRTIPCN